MTRALLISNPFASRAHSNAVTTIRDILQGGGWKVDVHTTARPGDARPVAEEARGAGYDVFVSHGGDGTAMQVAAGIVGTGITLALLPGGTGNVLARNLSLPRSAASAARALLKARRLQIDLGVVDRDNGPHYFAVVCGTGFDAQLMADTDLQAKRRWKFGAYLARAVTSLATVRSVPHRVIVDGTPHDIRAAMVLVLNCGRLAPGFLNLPTGWYPMTGGSTSSRSRPTAHSKASVRSPSCCSAATRTAGGFGGRAGAQFGWRCRTARTDRSSSTGRSRAPRRSRPGSCRVRCRCSWVPTSRLIMADALLLVTDDRTALDELGAHFERLGYSLRRETSGAAAVATFRHSRADVVLLELPRSDGLGVLERLRREGAAVIVLTAQGDREGTVEAMMLGAENVLTKPVDMALLAAAVARVAEKARLSRENARLLARVHEIERPTERRYHAHTLSEVERKHIERALRHHGGNRTHAALELGISRATLINKIKAYSLNL
jgi:diacylglycerol kinase family enzyme/DNA-binding response OmpR family regulator